MRRLHTAALALSAAIAFFVGGWAFFAPRSFFDSFPGVLGRWVATDGPFNEHLVRDVGAFYLALGVASVAGLVWRSPVVFRILGLAWTMFGVLHLWYHVTHLDHLQADAAVGTVVSLSISLALGVVLLIPSRADVADPTDATGTTSRAGGVGSATSDRTTTKGETR
ncbi:hypothetical protein BCL57_001551 [Agromyces flavus]|uniref:DoxX-like family protein n=1 Tax=Agromyces flavus TaxID=589382 RepID=A0A1H2A321_9MICO|nr:hypothetical protein [Agromyces flavus]MCP2367397.1 hypothetical protein [Agromyces flavus]GGI45806.1 hypothetical protein GCM10010932_11430 [Agromyces flavus]SDT40172.1 hypothetical protein SAMN04489721_3475 [Agromyces flavus]